MLDSTTTLGFSTAPEPHEVGDPDAPASESCTTRCSSSSGANALAVRPAAFEAGLSANRYPISRTHEMTGTTTRSGSVSSWLNSSTTKVLCPPRYARRDPPLREIENTGARFVGPAQPALFAATLEVPRVQRR
jgi:hypothetical protein